MNFEERVRSHFTAAAETQRRTGEAQAARIAEAAQLVAGSLRAGGKLLACGNGGSAADAQHLAAEFTNRFERERPPLAAVALTTDTSALTAIGNDYSFDEIFAKQVAALARPGDVLVAISTSGGSPNVAAAAAAAHRAEARVVALTGRDGGRLAAALAPGDIELRVPAERTAHIQEAHIAILHCLCDLVDEILYPQ